MVNKHIDSIQDWSWVLAVSVPEAYYFHLQDANVTVDTHIHSEILFYFLKDDKIKTTKSDTIPTCHAVPYKTLYGHELPSELKCNWTPPPYQEHFSKISKLQPAKPIIVVNNKYNEEWGNSPYNFLDEKFLNKLFSSKLSEKFDFYYIRYNSSFDTDGYYDDVGSDGGIKDYDLIKDFKNVTSIYDVMSKYKIGFNEAQMWMHSHASHSVAAAGAGAVLSCYFGNNVFIYNHPSCPSSGRRIWSTDSWLKNLGKPNVWGYKNYDEMLTGMLDEIK